ncbi:FHA domain-containing protein [Euzebya tangerina]|uniref:FHA domain-containing protein n=1 Tax=Euzebya tangerina TaxID=591198 RepID=UPI000E30DDED|nr:FHA domain-containing protein [Euzebya tangerina]
MSSEDVHVALVPGDGVVARRGVGLMVMLPGGADEVREQLVAAFEEACTDEATPGRMMARKLVGLLSQSDPDALPPFGACAPNERGWAVILHQGVALHLTSAGETEVVSGYDASTWVDRIVDGEFDAMSLLADGSTPPEVDSRFRLDSGVVPGAGATIVPRDAVPGARPAAPAAQMAVPAAQPAAAMEETADEPAETSTAPSMPQAEADTAADVPADAGAEPSADEPAAGQQTTIDSAQDETITSMPEAPPVDADPGLPGRQPPPATPPPDEPSGGIFTAGPAPAPPAPGLAEQTPAVQTPAAPPPLPSGFAQAPTPTDNPEQQGVFEATPASQDIPRSLTDPAAADPADNAPQHEEEDEPPTLIQAPSREAAEPAPIEGTPEPEAMPDADVAFESVPLADIGIDGKREALPVLTVDTPKEETEDSDAPLVHGVMSPAGYFNHPDALYCAVTGVAMLHRTHVLVERPRPPLGVVVADDGSTFTLNANYVVGREPERDPLVDGDDARPLKLQDTERSLSRVHAEIRLQDWDVFVVDRGSANGTYVLPRGAQQWKRLVADVEEKIVPGTRVAFGKRVVTYESHHQINQAAG